MTAQPKPIVDVPLSEALECLTGFELLAIEKRFGCKSEDLGGTSLLIGVVWAYLNRDGKKTAWNVVETMTLKQLKDSFVPEDDQDVAGKSSAGAEPTPS